MNDILYYEVSTNALSSQTRYDEQTTVYCRVVNLCPVEELLQHDVVRHFSSEEVMMTYRLRHQWLH